MKAKDFIIDTHILYVYKNIAHNQNIKTIEDFIKHRGHQSIEEFRKKELGSWEVEAFFTDFKDMMIISLDDPNYIQGRNSTLECTYNTSEYKEMRIFKFVVDKELVFMFFFKE